MITRRFRSFKYQAHLLQVRTECAAGDENCKYYKEGRSAQARTNVLIGVTSALGVATAAEIDHSISSTSSQMMCSTQRCTSCARSVRVVGTTTL